MKIHILEYTNRVGAPVCLETDSKKQIKRQVKWLEKKGIPYTLKPISEKS